MKIVMILDQIQSGLGTKDDKHLALGGKPEAIGPAIMMAPMFKKIDAKVIASLYCGTETFNDDREEISRKFCTMVNKLNPDVVICGPAYNYIDFAEMSAYLCNEIQEKCNTIVVTAMSEENENTIKQYKDQIDIIKMPKKGGFGLNDSLQTICTYIQSRYNQEDTTQFIKEIGYK